MLQRLLYQPEKGRTCEEQAEVSPRPRCTQKDAKQQPPSTETTAPQQQLGAPARLLLGQRGALRKMREARRAGHHGRARVAQELGQLRAMPPAAALQQQLPGTETHACRKAPPRRPGPGPRPPAGQRASPEPQHSPSRLSPLDIAPVSQEIIEDSETSSGLKVPEAHDGSGAANRLPHAA